MLSLGPYATFIEASYLVVLFVVTVLIAWISIDYRSQKRRLSELESGGVTRRSTRQPMEKI